MAEPRPIVVTFKRGAFYGDFRNTVPKWHLLAGEDPGKWGTFVAECGYTRSNILGDLNVSRSRTPKPAKDTCGKCVTARGKKQAQEQREERQGRRQQAPRTEPVLRDEEKS